MDLIAQKEQELAELKKKTAQDNWLVYLEKVKIFLDKLKGRTIISWTSNGSFYLYKVLDYKEHYYMDIDGYHGQWSPRRYFVLKTTGYLTFQVPYADGSISKYSPPSIDENSWFNDFYIPFRCTRLVKVKGKHKESLIFPKFDMRDEELANSVSTDTINLVTIGKIAYEKNIPDYDNSLQSFFSCSRLIENDFIFTKALEMHKKRTLEVLDFYKEFEKELKGAKQYTTDLL